MRDTVEALDWGGLGDVHLVSKPTLDKSGHHNHDRNHDRDHDHDDGQRQVIILATLHELHNSATMDHGHTTKGATTNDAPKHMRGGAGPGSGPGSGSGSGSGPGSEAEAGAEEEEEEEEEVEEEVEHPAVYASMAAFTAMDDGFSTAMDDAHADYCYGWGA